MFSNYTYAKLRREYGKQCRFSKCGPIVLENLMPDPSQEEQWLPKNPINKSTSKTIDWSEHEVTYLDLPDSGIFVFFFLLWVFLSIKT